MVVGALSTRTELAIIGAGPGGYVAALRAADKGIEVTLIDRAELGGTCLNVGCIPSKTLIELANIRHAALAADGHGLTAQVAVDLPGITSHLASVRSQLRGGVETLLADAGVQFVHGEANFARYDRLIIAHDDQVSHLEFDDVIIATGSRPRDLPGFPFDGQRVVSSTGALFPEKLPASIAIVGGGYIGVELGTAWAKLGVTVTIVEAAASILPEVAPQLRQPVVRRLSALGIDVLTGSVAERPTETGLVLSTGRELAAELIVVAVGRQPNSDQTLLNTLPITIGETGHVQVDSQMRAAQGIYAIGDLVTGPALAHKASAEAEVAVDAILGQPTTFDPAAIPAVIYSDPEIMTAGVDPASSAALGLDVSHFPHVASARGRTLGSTTGATFVVTDSAGTVVGVHAVGPHVSELAGEAALAVELAATIEDLSLTIHPHPTMSESVAEAAWLARGSPLHIRR